MTLERTTTDGGTTHVTLVACPYFGRPIAPQQSFRDHLMVSDCSGTSTSDDSDDSRDDTDNDHQRNQEVNKNGE